ncbi:Uncharacterised protein [uncultured archaeon]|nr:Uncharacterised protein [uncultured archaeon]
MEATLNHVMPYPFRKDGTLTVTSEQILARLATIANKKAEIETAFEQFKKQFEGKA